MTIEQHLTQFISERCHAVPGAKTPLSRFADEFLLGYLPEADREQFSRRDVAIGLDALAIERGVSGAGQVVLANFSLPTFRLVVRDGKVIRSPL